MWDPLVVVLLRLCERVVMLEDLLDVLESRLVQVEEQKAQGSQTARDLAALQEVLLAEAEKVNENSTQSSFQPSNSSCARAAESSFPPRVVRDTRTRQGVLFSLFGASTSGQLFCPIIFTVDLLCVLSSHCHRQID